MKRSAVVIETAGNEAVVSVLREEACGSCAGRRFCGNAAKLELRVKNKLGDRKGDTVIIEAPSGVLLEYTALLFLAPVLLAVVLYFVFVSVNEVLSYFLAGAGFVLPYFAAFFIEKRTRVAVPVIIEVLAPVTEYPPCCGNGDETL